MRAVKRNNFIDFIMIVVTILNPFTSNNASHAVTNKDVAGGYLAVKVGVLTNGIKSFLTM